MKLTRLAGGFGVEWFWWICFSWLFGWGTVLWGLLGWFF